MNYKKNNGVYAPYYYKAREEWEKEEKQQEMKRLFKKYKNPLVKLANNRFGRKFLNIDVGEKIDELFTGGFSWRTDKKGVYTAQFKTPFQYAQKIGVALTKWDIARDYLKESEHKLYRSLADYRGLLHYVGLDDLFRLPAIYLLESTTKAVSGGSGSLRVANANWTTAREATTAGNVDADGINLLYTRHLFGEYACTRIMLPFDTSAIEGAVASAAVLSYYSGQDSGTLDGTYLFVLTPSTQVNKATLNADDYNNITLNSSLECAPRFDAENNWVKTVGAEHTFTYDDSDCLALIANGTGGFTQLAIRTDRDVDSSPPASETNCICYPADGANGTDTNRPKLVVTYTPALASQSQAVWF